MDVEREGFARIVDRIGAEMRQRPRRDGLVFIRRALGAIVGCAFGLFERAGSRSMLSEERPSADELILEEFRLSYAWLSSLV